jgi:hypothetical protein
MTARRRTVQACAMLAGVPLAAMAPMALVHAQNPPPPTDMDLRVMYCRPVVAGAISRYAQTLSANAPPAQGITANEHHAAALERSRRLELYILPRLGAVDTAPLLTAQARGKDDAARWRNSRAPATPNAPATQRAGSSAWRAMPPSNASPTATTCRGCRCWKANNQSTLKPICATSFTVAS